MPEDFPAYSGSLRRVTRIVCAAALVAIVALLAAACVGCFTPPLVLPGGMDIRDVTKLPYPAAAEAVDVEVEPGRFLHGVFVPSDDGAPIVVHLLESTGSFTPTVYSAGDGGLTLTAVVARRQVVWELADLGLASLIVDYSGVGPSDGERDPATLLRDAQAIYAEALRRAGGQEQRLVLRGTSIGALAAALLLDAGRRPAALLLVAPVRSETVAKHFARATHGAFAAFLVAPFLRRGVDVDLVGVLSAADLPLVAVAAREDELLPADEQALLRAAVERAGGAWIALAHDDGTLVGGRSTINGRPLFPAGDHFPLAYTARQLLDPERTLLVRVYPDPPGPRTRFARLLAELDPALRERFPDGSAERASLQVLAAGRLHDDGELAALTVLAGCTPDECRAYLDAARRTGEGYLVTLDAWMQGLDRERCLRRLDLSDPAGRVPVELVLNLAHELSSAGDEPTSGGAWQDVSWDLEHTLAFARGAAVKRTGPRAARRKYRNETSRIPRYVPIEGPWTRLIDAGVGEDDTCRLVLRAFLKGVGIEERVLVDEQGGARLEVLDGGTFRPVDPRLLLDETTSAPAPADEAAKGF